MTPLARSWLRRIALGIPFVIVPAASPLLLGVSACGPCGGGTTDRTFVIDTAQAAQILDMQGHATSQGCRAVCAQIVTGAIDGARPDGSLASDAGVSGVTSNAAASCDVISSGTALEVTCHFSQAFGCGGREPSGLVRRAMLARASAGAWLARMAWMETASIDAFEMLADELRMLGAPADLVHGARDAACDEQRHASAVGRLARARGFEPEAPQRVASAPRSLEALAIDNAIEGGVRETFGALLAAHQASAALDAEVRGAMRLIARDEAAHALLSARIDTWARTRMDPTVLDAARREAATELARSITAECDDDAALSLGLPCLDDQRALALALA